MKTYTKEELAETIKLHGLWLCGDANGKQANLRGADLRGADLREADLREADLCYANLRGADLCYANLHGATLRVANLRGADLCYANLHGAALRVANLRGADLSGADLRGADLSGADLRGADLCYANLRGANLSGAELGARSIVPDEGAFVGWKKVFTPRGKAVLKLQIPAEAKRTSSYVGRKCRAEFVVVLEGEGCSARDSSVYYKPGATVRSDSYDPDPRVECTHGIHFFITRKEAEDYNP